MFLNRIRIILTVVIVFFLTFEVSAQSYNTEVEAKLQIKEENGRLNVKGTALNKTSKAIKISYKLSVFKTGSNKNISSNKQSGKSILNTNEQKYLSSTSINFNKETKVIILLLIYDSNLTIIGKDRVVFNDNKENNIAVKKDIAYKVNNTVAKFSKQVINEDFEAKIQVNNQNEIIIINGTVFNKTEITSSLKYKFTVFNKNEGENNIEEEKDSRFILSANEKVNLSSIAFKLNGDIKKIAVLSIYNLDNILVAEDRIVFNEGLNDKIVRKKELNKKLKQEQENSKDVSIGVKDGIELRGIVVEDTKTKPGRDFYKLFSSLYTRNNINGNEVVKVKEVLAIGRNTKIQVIVGDDVVFSFFVRPSIDYLTKINDYAIIKVYKHFKNSEKESKTIKYY
ncbi:curli production assembly/transport protein CsgE [Polaribacter sp. Z014]|uniref:curli production assembly/transport protein CsgE n=1 Tax=Polaribacter sp. Z014 TaxID=2927126 RepID=UPI002022108F|nr:curli production assembly/transport protein CsgE [Polaribacter sp. Z014]MCL7764384.1 curli production assembly/transport protein CsgE [Polaribacter sp. Z014]